MRTILVAFASLIAACSLLSAQTQTSVPVKFSDQVGFDGLRVNLAECHLISVPTAVRCNVHVENVGQEGIKAVGLEFVFRSGDERGTRTFVGADYAFPHPKSKGKLERGKEDPLRVKLIYGEKVPTGVDVTLKFLELEYGDVIPPSAKDTDDYKQLIENRKNAGR